jgi:hypothetical protein
LSTLGQPCNHQSIVDVERDDSCQRNVINLGNYVIVFFSLDNWRTIMPISEDHIIHHDYSN